MNIATFFYQPIPTQIFNLLRKMSAHLESFRIKNHLRIVEIELQRKNVDYLSLELKQEREKNISHLHDYWTKGLFPKNTDFVNKRVPYFKDKYGTPCAVAFLIEQSGNYDLVDDVARSNNHVYVNDINDGPVFDWIRRSGLTKTEAARIQPGYQNIDRSTKTYKIDQPSKTKIEEVQPRPAHINQTITWIFGTALFFLFGFLIYRFSLWIKRNYIKK